MFGHGFKIFFKDVFAKHADTFADQAKEAKINLFPKISQA